jgi:ribosomal protein L37AE/L43A
MLHTDFVASTEALGGLQTCAQCGDSLIAPTWSQHVNDRCIRHFWECEACDYQFETAVYFQARTT